MAFSHLNLTCTLDDKEQLYRRIEDYDGKQSYVEWGWMCNACGHMFAMEEEADLHVMLVNIGGERRTPPNGVIE